MALTAIPAMDIAPLLITLTLSFFAAIGVVAFVTPLFGIHRLMVDEKERMVDEAGARLKTALDGLDARMDDGDLSDIVALHNMIESLELRVRVVERIPTWPWRPETLRAVISLFFAPLLLLVLQLALQQLL